MQNQTPITSIMTIRDRHNMGRPINAKTAQARAAAMRAIVRTGRGTAFTVNDIAKKSKKNKQDLRFALRFFEAQGYLTRVDTEQAKGARHGAGRRRILWMLCI